MIERESAEHHTDLVFQALADSTRRDRFSEVLADDTNGSNDRKGNTT